MRSHLRSPIMWVGGKARLLPWLLPLLEACPCRVYVEPFGGSAAVLLNRPRAHHEVYNDLDQSLANFMLCVREHPAELARLIAGLPYCRSHFEAEQEWLRLGCPGRMTDLQRAARWWWIGLSGYGGQLTAGWGTRVGENNQQVLAGRVAGLTRASARLAGVTIESRGFAEIIAAYDSPWTLFYCDPPYVGTEDAYHGAPRFGEPEHRELARLLGGIAGQAAVSYYPCALVDELYPAPRWTRHEKRWHTSLSNARSTEQPERVELLLTSYRPPAQASLALGGENLGDFT